MSMEAVFMKIYSSFITEDMYRSMLEKQKEKKTMNSTADNLDEIEQSKIYINKDSKANCAYYVANEGWNDNFNIIDTFNVYINGLETNNYIGQVKIYSEFKNNDPYNICQSFLNIDAGKIKSWPRYYQIGADIDFYKNLKEKVDSEEYIKSFLATDVIFKPKNLSHVNSYFVDNSFLRDDSAVKLRDLYNIRKNLNTYDQFLSLFTDNGALQNYFSEESNCKNFIEKCIKADILHKNYSINLINTLAKIELSKNLNVTTIDFLNECSKLLKEEPLLDPIVGKRISGNTTDVVNKVNEIKSILSIDKKDVEENTIELGQYTSLSTLPKVIRKEDTFLRLTNVRQLNDPLEGIVLPEYLEEENKNAYNSTKIFISSATSNIDDLPMWRQYADDCKGICLIYDKEFLNKLLDKKNNMHIYRMAYLDKNDKVILSELNDEEDLSDKEAKIKGLLSAIKEKLQDKKDTGYELSKRYVDSIGYLFKRSSYSYENEFRIIADIYGKDALDKYIFCEPSGDSRYPVPFVYYYARDEKNNKIPLAYHSVKLGPKCMDRDYVEPYLIHCKGNNIEINRSKIANR